MNNIDVVSGQKISLNVKTIDDVEFAEKGNDLLVKMPDEETSLYLKNFFLAAATEVPPMLTYSDGSVISAAEITGKIDDFDPSIIAPAAGGGSASSSGGAGFDAYADDGIGNGISTENLLEATELEFELETVERSEVVEQTINVDDLDPCSELFDVRVAAYRAAFPDQKSDDGDKYGFSEGSILAGDHIPSSGDAQYSVGQADRNNDIIDANDFENGQNWLVGDIYKEITDRDNFDLEVSYSGSEATDNPNATPIFSDKLIADDATTLIVGDMLVVNNSDINAKASIDLTVEPMVDASLPVSFVPEDKIYSNIEFNSFNDSIVGGVNTTTMIGDIAYISNNSELGDEDGEDLNNNKASLTASLSFSANTQALTNNEFNTYNDIIDGTAGLHDQLIVGDGAAGNERLEGNGEVVQWTDMTISNSISLSASMGNDISGNEFYQNNDLLTGGDGNDIIVGDAYLEAGQLPDDLLSPSHTEPSRLDLDTSISLSSRGSFEIGNEPGVYIPLEGGVIEDNFFSTFNDIIDGGAGSDTLVGDSFMENNLTNGEIYRNPPEVVLQAELNVGIVNEVPSDIFNDISTGEFDEFYTIPGIVRNNTASEFNDIIRGDDGTGIDDGNQNDLIVGDMLVTGYSVNVELKVEREEKNYNEPIEVNFGISENNQLTAFSDTLIGGLGDDTIVGDVAFIAHDDDQTMFIQMLGNKYLDDYETQREDAVAFSDYLCGGAGDDLLVGDFLGNYEYRPIGIWNNGSPYEIHGFKALTNDETQFSMQMFNDTLHGNEGNDTLLGQMGDDVLMGGSGSDEFRYEGSHLWDVIGADTVSGDDYINLTPDNPVYLAEGHDVIMDFNHETEGDTINLDTLFDNLGIGENEDLRAYQVNIADNVLTVEGIDNFSITVKGDNLSDISMDDNFTSNQLSEMGIVVSDVS
ncbi:hypothetical protein A9Q83_10060 [Alphaproteobacteria bacterium 46_93_T64]|nr:hypothetical protein A9Q83_10060 [Alphaproteobacteria bacterium 46_93_T64]